MATVSIYSPPGTVTLENVASPPGDPYELPNALANLQPGDSAAFPIPSWGSWGAILTETTRWHWDTINGIGWLWGQDNGYGTLIKYTRDSNLFERVYYQPVAAWGGTAAGRAYDSTCLDSSGNFYLMTSGDGQLRRFNGTGFDLVGNALGATTTSYYALGFHPNLYGAGVAGFIWARGGNIRHYPLSAGLGGTWTAVANGTGASGTNFATAIYGPVLNRMLVTQGNAGTSFLSITAGATPTRTLYANGLPVSCTGKPAGVPESGRLVRHALGIALLENAANGRVWFFDGATNSFVLQAQTHPLHGADTNWVVLPVNNCYWALRQVANGASPPTSILWRPAA